MQAEVNVEIPLRERCLGPESYPFLHQQLRIVIRYKFVVFIVDIETTDIQTCIIQEVRIPDVIFGINC